jgi:hypothetical protein
MNNKPKPPPHHNIPTLPLDDFFSLLYGNEKNTEITWDKEGRFFPHAN